LASKSHQRGRGKRFPGTALGESGGIIAGAGRYLSNYDLNAASLRDPLGQAAELHLRTIGQLP
jgi:hypothetical protein